MATRKKTTSRPKGPTPTKDPEQPPEERTPTPEELTQAQLEDAQRRATACNQHVQAALNRFRCRLVVRSETKDVGNTGEVLVTPRAGIEPLA